MLKLTTNKSPDILDCIANLSNDEVFTSPKLANEILDLLPPEVWKNKELTFLDPACKTGVFLREIAKRLLVGLADEIPDEDARREHIFQNMIFGVAITELTGMISRRTLYYTKNATKDESVVKLEKADGNIIYQNTRHFFKGDACSVCGASKEAYSRGDSAENHAYSFIHENIETLFKEHFTAKGKPMKFDVIVGNPPYQLKDDGHGASASPLYHLFIEQAKKLNPKYMSFIVPSRWFAGGKGLDSFREEMLKDTRIKKLVDFPDASDCFPGVEIKGGVNYFLWDNSYSGPCEVVTHNKGLKPASLTRNLNEFDIFVRFNQAVSILNKVKAFKEPTMDTMVSSQKPFGFRTNFNDYTKTAQKDSIKLYARGEIGYVDREKILQNEQWIDKWKVLTARAAEGGGELPNKVMGIPVIAPKNSCCTETYLVCGVFDSEKNAKNLETYMKSKFLRFLVFLRKTTQDTSKDRFLFVPIQNLDVEAPVVTDEQLYKKYKLNKEEIAFIDSIVKEMP